MKQYTKPMIEVIELQSKENMAAVNPLNATGYTTTSGVYTTVYNLALMGEGSKPVA